MSEVINKGRKVEVYESAMEWKFVENDTAAAVFYFLNTLHKQPPCTVLKYSARNTNAQQYYSVYSIVM